MTVRGNLATAAVLDRLDGVLAEAARREHRFAWLTDPDDGGWVALDAYYPRNRVVVMVADHAPIRTLCEQIVPAQGFFLLTVSPSEITADPDAVAAGLRRRLLTLGWSAPGGPGPGVGLAPRTGPPVHGGEAPSGPSPQRLASSRSVGTGSVGSGVLLTVVVMVEVAVGGGVVGLGAGDPLLGFAFLIDACARILGTVAASRAGDLDAAWASILWGSPALWSAEATGDRDRSGSRDRSGDRDRSKGRDGRGAGSGDAAAAAQVSARVAAVAFISGLVLALA